MRGVWRWAPLLWTPKDMLSKAVEMGVCFHRGPAFGEHGVTLFWGTWSDALLGNME